MSRTSYADLINDWQMLLTASTDNAEDLPQLEATRGELQSALDRALAIAGEREGMSSRRAQLSRDLESILIEGKDAAIKIRAGARAKYGATSERLLQFRIKPVRRKLRVERAKKKAGAGDQPPTPAPHLPHAVT